MVCLGQRLVGSPSPGVGVWGGSWPCRALSFLLRAILFERRLDSILRQDRRVHLLWTQATQRGVDLCACQLEGCLDALPNEQLSRDGARGDRCRTAHGLKFRVGNAAVFNTQEEMHDIPASGVRDQRVRVSRLDDSDIARVLKMFLDDV